MGSLSTIIFCCILSIACIAIAVALLDTNIMPTISQSSRELFQLFFIIMAAIFPFVGVLER